MTIANTTRKTGPYAGNGVTVSFAISFDFFSDSSYVRVTKKTTADDDDNGTILTNPTHFSVVGANVIMVTAPATGEEILIELILPETQLYDYIAGGVFPQTDHETNLDRLIRLVQQLSQKLARAPLVNVFSTYTGLTLPTPVDGYLLSWKSDLSGLENVVTVGDITNAAAYAASALASKSSAAASAVSSASSASAASSSESAAAASAAAAAASLAALVAVTGTPFQEVLTGVFAAGDTVFTASHTPIAATLLAILGVLPQAQTTDYVLSSNTITFVGQDVSGLSLLTLYRY